MMGDGAAAIILGPGDSEPKAGLSRNFFGHIGLGRASGFALADGGSDQPFLFRRSRGYSIELCNAEQRRRNVAACSLERDEFELSVLTN
jgi:hypothetical protein